jgi:hypothetical protein
VRAALLAGALLLFSAVATAQHEEPDAGAEEVDPASDPPEVEDEPEEPATRTRVSGRLTSEMFFTQRPRMRHIGDGRYAVRSDNVFPFYETIELRADEIGHPGFSLHFQGWAGLDLAEIHFDQRFVADPTYLYLQFKDRGLDFRVGRQLLFSGVTRGLHLDGAYAAYETEAHLGIEAHGGLVVSPYRGPEWYREQPGDLGYDDFGASFSDLRREGDYAAGGRVFYRVSGRASAGISVLHVTELDEVDRQLLGADLDVTPVRWLGVSGDAAIDLHASALREANLALDVMPLDLLSVSAEYRHADPTLYLSQMSIFSVFSDEEYDSVGGTVYVDPLGWLGLHAGYHHRFYSYIAEAGEPGVAEDHAPEVDTGYEVVIGAAMSYGARREGRVVVDFRRLTESETGLRQLRIGAVIPLFVKGLRAAASAYLDIFDQPAGDLYGADVDATSGATSTPEQHIGFLGEAGLYYGNGTLEAGGSVAAGATPYAEHEVRGLLKLIYNFQVSFFEEVEP